MGFEALSNKLLSAQLTTKTLCIDVKALGVKQEVSSSLTSNNGQKTSARLWIVSSLGL